MIVTAKKQSEAPRLKKRRIHKRTLAIVFCFVLLPWFLVAIPGTTSRASASSFPYSQMRHGWPFVHLHTTEVKTLGELVSGKFVFGQKPIDQELNELVRDYADSLGSKDFRPPIKLDLRFYRSGELVSWQGIGHWSENRFWPRWKPGWLWSPRYIGLLLNLSFLAIASGLVIAFCEYRIRRRGRLVNFSLRSILAATALAALLIAWGVREFNESKSIAKSIELFKQWDTADHNVDYETRLPLVVSQLFNHGKHPWGTTPFFFRAKSGEILIWLNEFTPANIDQITELAFGSGYLINLDVRNFNAQRQQMLSKFDGENVYVLSIDFNSDVWVYQAIGDDAHDTGWEEAKNLANLKLDLNISFPKLESLYIELDSTLDQVDQLKIFTGLQSLKTGNISNLSTGGAEYILKTKDQWPTDMHLDYLDDVTDELKAKLDEAFKPIHQLHLSVVPVVGSSAPR